MVPGLEKLTTFLPYRTAKFESVEFNIANDYNEYLKRDYKNWKKLPNRIEFAKHVKLYGELSEELFNKPYYISYEDLCVQEGYTF